MWDVPQLERTTSVSGATISTVPACSHSRRPYKNRSINLPIQVCWKGQMNPKQSRVEGSFEHHRYVAVDAIPHKPKLGIVYRLLLRVVMCFCNDEGLLVGPRTAVTILAANRKSGCVGPICSLVTFFLSQMMFRAGNPCCPRIVILRCYSVVESIKLVYAIWPWRSVYYVQGWVAYRA
jgi:hypothetical protein